MADEDIVIYSITEFPDAIPMATSIRVYKCPSCRNAHVVLFDLEDNPMAQFTMASKTLDYVNAHAKVVFECEAPPPAEVIAFPVKP